MKTIKRVYFINMIISCFSILIAMFLINLVVKNNNYIQIDLEQDIYKLEILPQQAGILRFLSYIPLLIFIVNILLFVFIYIIKKNLLSKKMKMTALIWIASGIAYVILPFLNIQSGSSAISILTIVIMILFFFSKIVLIVLMLNDVREERSEQYA